MSRSRIAVAAAGTHWLLSATTQVWVFCFFLPPTGALRLANSLPFLQAQSAAVEVGLGLVTYAPASNRVARWLILPIHAALSAYLLGDQFF